MLRIAIVGCGKIADQHVQAIQRIPACRIVSLCDQELLMAKQLGERIGVSKCFSDLGEMLEEMTPEVVHITTPPQGHYALAKKCIESGAHVYLEKPFTVTAEEAESLIHLADDKERNLVAGHNYQYTLEMLEMRRLVEQGYLGGKPIHLESHYAYDLDDLSYVRPILGNRRHWVRQLPGQLFHNVISHGIARLAEFLDDDLSEIVAQAHQSGKMQRLGGEEVLDELRVMIRDRNGMTAFFCFSSQIKPGLSQFRICGPKNSILVDQTSGSIIRNKKRNNKSYLTFFVPPLLHASEHLQNVRRNIGDFTNRRLYQDSGMTELIRRFYRSIQLKTPPPVPYREIALTARIMDEIFAQVYRGSRLTEPERTECALV
jgi:predicted dehydrogenase